MKELTDQEKIRTLHEINSDIYKVIDRVNDTGVYVGLAFADLRNATINIQKAIGDLINKITESEKNEHKE
jgi:hypothetical protein